MKKDKVVLVNPGIHFQEPLYYGMYPNTAIMVLATILHNAGFRVKVIDGKYKKIDDAVKGILGEIDESLIFIGFSVMTVQLPWAYYVSKAVKSKNPDTKIVWGGVHPTLFPEQTARDKAVDIVVVNDAARTVASLAAALAAEGDISSIPGLFYKEGSGITSAHGDRVMDDFNCVPMIDFSLIDHNRYSRNNNIAIEEFYAGKYEDCRVYPVITGLGCAYKCTFCINVILNRKYHFRDAAEIVDRIKLLRRDYGADFIQPMDENFFINRKRTFEFLDLLEKENLRIKWRPQTRADYFNDNYLNLEVARRLDRCGMVVAAMGVESASQRILDKLNKQLRVEQIIKAAEILSKTNIVPKMNFMTGLPGETEDDIKKTYRLAVRLRKMIGKSCVTISPFRPYPGSPLYDQIVREYGYSPPSTLEDWARLSQSEFAEGVGYESFERYKWIKNPGKLKAMQCVYGEIAWYRPQRDDKLHGKIRSFIAFMRFKFDFFLFVFLEKRFFDDLSRLKSFIKRLKNGVNPVRDSHRLKSAVISNGVKEKKDTKIYAED
ncbi:MAG: radical SAM protein [Candidatus Omnitrophota bacterium]